jgi:hypothetical protein
VDNEMQDERKGIQNIFGLMLKMYTDTDLKKIDNLLSEAYRMREKIKAVKIELASLKGNYRQLIIFCKEAKTEIETGKPIHSCQDR